MEEITRGAVGAGLNSLWFTVGLVVNPTQARIRCAPIATLVFSEVIAMRVLGHSAVVGNYLCLWVTELLSCGFPNIVNPPLLYFF